MEKSDGAALSLTKNQITVPVHRYEIVSVRVEFAQSHYDCGKPLEITMERANMSTKNSRASV